MCGRVINQFVVQVLLFSNFPRLKFVPQKRMVRVAGFEPARYFYRKILSLLRTACFATPAYLIKSLENFLFPFNMIIITYNHQVVKALIKLSFYFFLKFLFRCVPKTVKMVHSLPFDFIVGCKASFGNILGTLTRKLLHHISLQVILSSCNYRLTNCIFILPHKHCFVNSLILKF